MARDEPKFCLSMDDAKDKLHYENDAKNMACVERQLDVFEGQMQHLNGFVESFSGRMHTPLEELRSSSSFAAQTKLLERRQETSVVLKELQRKVDDVEHALMCLLDSEGRISLPGSMAELVVIMTKVSVVDHRFMALHMLLNDTTKDCQAHFVRCEGLRLLRRWMRLSQEEGRTELLRMCLALCRQLPFDENAVRRSEIGKAIKKASKHKIEADNAQELRDDAKGLMHFWRDELTRLAEAKASGRAQTTSTTALTERAIKIVTEFDEKLVSERGVPSEKQKQEEEEEEEEEKTTTKAKTKAKASGVETVAMDVDEAESEANVEPASTAMSKSVSRKRKGVSDADPAGVDAAPAKAKAKVAPAGRRARQALAAIDTESLLDGDDDDDDVVSSSSSSSSSSGGGSNSSSSYSSSNSRGGVLDLLKQVPKSSPKASTSPTSPEGRAKAFQMSFEPTAIDDADGSDAVAAAPQSNFEVEVGPHAPDPAAKPGRGGLKKKTGTKKRSLLWRDLEDKGNLFDTHLLVGNFHHVDTVPSSGQSQSVASHEKSKKARMKEKEASMSKIRESMKQSIAWIAPPLLSLPESVNEIVRLTVSDKESEERATHTSRLKKVLETRYPDDSMIPPNPDTPPELATSTSEEDPLPVPWYGDEEEEEQLDGVDAGYQLGDGNEAIQGGNTEANNAALVKQLPEVLQQFPPEFLAQLVEDQSKMDMILNSDGTLNQGKVALLRMQMVTGASLSRSTSGAGAMPPQADSNSRFARRRDTGPTTNSTGGGMNMPGVASKRSGGDAGAGPVTKGPVPCRNFNSPSGFCSFGDRCTFAHVKVKPKW